MSNEVNQKVVADTAKLMMHGLIARQIRRDPTLVEKAKVAHARQAGQFAGWPFVHEWDELLSLAPDRRNRNEPTHDIEGGCGGRHLREKSFGDSIDEFLDTFYLDHPDKKRQQERIDDSPPIIGNPSEDAWVGAVGEHLVRRWGLAVPAWTIRPEHYLLDRPKFVPDSRALRSILICESPAAFRSTETVCFTRRF